MSQTNNYASLKDQKLSNDFVFRHVMLHEDVCKLFLEELLGIQISTLTFMEGEKVLNEDYESHGIRLDVMVKDIDGNVYDIEMQNIKETNHIKRARYYHSTIDRYTLKHGFDYEKLPNSVVIFICSFDAFGYERAIYRVQNMLTEFPEYPYDDGSVTYFLNSMYKVSNTGDSIEDFLTCVNGIEDSARTTLAHLTVDALQTVRKDKRLEDEFMTFQMKMYDTFKQGKAEGRAEGKDERSNEVALDMLINHEPLALIVKYSKLDVNNIREIAKKHDLVVIEE